MTSWYALLKEKDDSFEHSHMTIVLYEGKEYVRFASYGNALYNTALSVARANRATLLKVTCEDEDVFDFLSGTFVEILLGAEYEH